MVEGGFSELRTLKPNEVAGFYSIEEAIELTKTTTTPKNKIKILDSGFGKKLSYVSGKTVIETLNSTYGAWSFEILSEEMVDCIPKARTIYDPKLRKRVPALDKDGNQIYDDQAPYALVRGRLYVPGLGFRDEYGSQAIVGGQSEQLSAFKAAATDCLKKCASLFGIHLDIYESEEDKAAGELEKEIPIPAPPKVTPPQKPNLTTSSYKTEDLEEMKKIKTALNIKTNEELNDKVAIFLEDEKATYRDINPSNIAQFCKFMRANYLADTI